jgi:hypothetical protein
MDKLPEFKFEQFSIDKCWLDLQDFSSKKALDYIFSLFGVPSWMLNQPGTYSTTSAITGTSRTSYPPLKSSVTLSNRV